MTQRTQPPDRAEGASVAPALAAAPAAASGKARAMWNHPWVRWALKLAATLLLLWFALRRVPFHDLARAFTQLHGGLVVLSIALFQVLIIPVESVRFWASGRQVAEEPAGFRRWITLYVESRPFMYLLPASVGAEGLVWVRLRQLQWTHASCAFVVLATRTWGLTLWAAAAAVALASGNNLAAILAGTPRWFSSPVVWSLGGLIAAGTSAAAPWVFAKMGRIALSRMWPRGMAELVLASFASVLVCGLGAKLASSAAETPMPFIALLGLLAFFNFVTVLPISLGGIGVQEVLILRLGVPMGFAPASLLAFSAVLHAQRVALALLGLAVFARTRGPAPSPKSAAL